MGSKQAKFHQELASEAQALAGPYFATEFF
jgi:hypothetical protein